MMTNEQTCREYGTYFHIAVIVLLVAAIASSLWAGNQVTKMEMLKVGGEENFEKLQTIMKSDAYQEQYSQSLDLMLQQLNDTQPDDSMVYPGQEEISDEEIDAMINNSGDQELSEETDTQETTLPIIDSNETMGN